MFAILSLLYIPKIKKKEISKFVGKTYIVTLHCPKVKKRLSFFTFALS